MRVDKDVRLTQIGIDRIIRLSWLKKTAQYALAGSQVHESKVALQDEIKDSFQYDNQIVRGSLDKTITILTKTWFIVPNHLIPLRNDGLKLISNLPAVYHTPVHWGMLMAVYPFWGATATQVGRLLKIQPSVTASQVQRRLREQYGERETVSRSAQRAMRSYVDWKVLSETETKGVVTATNADVTSAPHNQSQTLNILSEGTVFNVLSIGNGWAEIQLGEKIKGFVKTTEVGIIDSHL